MAIIKIIDLNDFLFLKLCFVGMLFFLRKDNKIKIYKKIQKF